MCFNKYSATFFLFNAPAPTEIYTLSLHDALPICTTLNLSGGAFTGSATSSITGSADFIVSGATATLGRSEEHTSELQSRKHIVCRPLIEIKTNNTLTISGGTANFSGTGSVSPTRL